MHIDALSEVLSNLVVDDTRIYDSLYEHLDCNIVNILVLSEFFRYRLILTKQREFVNPKFT